MSPLPWATASMSSSKVCFGTCLQFTPLAIVALTRQTSDAADPGADFNVIDPQRPVIFKIRQKSFLRWLVILAQKFGKYNLS